MSTTPKLTSPLVVVVRDGADEPLRIQTANPDLVLWDRTRARHKWPGFQDAPFLWLTFISWAAAKRQGLIDAATTYESWEATALDVSAPDAATYTPTPPGPEPG